MVTRGSLVYFAEPTTNNCYSKLRSVGKDKEKPVVPTVPSHTGFIVKMSLMK